MADVKYDKLVGLVKKNGEITQAAAAQALGVTTGQLSQLIFCQAKVEAGVFKKAPATPPSVKKLRDGEDNRWELIAARTGLSVAAVKTAYEAAGGNVSNSYTGKGRNFGNGGGSGKKPAAGRSTGKPAGRQTGGKPAGRQTGKPAAAGRKTGRQTGGRRTTAGNPS